MAPNRIVAVLTPLVFAPLAGLVSAWLAQHVPGVDIDQNALEEIFIGGALIALAPALQWLHGWQKYEAREAEREENIELATIESGAASAAAEEPLPAEDALPPEDSGGLADFDDGFDDVDELDDVDESDEELFADEQLAGTQG